MALRCRLTYNRKTSYEWCSGRLKNRSYECTGHIQCETSNLAAFHGDWKKHIYDTHTIKIKADGSSFGLSNAVFKFSSVCSQWNFQRTTSSVQLMVGLNQDHLKAALVQLIYTYCIFLPEQTILALHHIHNTVHSSFVQFWRKNKTKKNIEPQRSVGHNCI